jgi:PAS domain S-box-containing protein
MAAAVCCGLSFWGQGALALDPQRAVTQYAIKTWQEDHGLPGGGLFSLAQTPDSYLWIGTSAGLVRFDGVRFVPVSVQAGRGFGEGTAAQVYADEDTLWIRNIYRELIAFKSGTATREAGPTGDPEFVYAMAPARDGGLWIMTQTNGLYRFAQGRFAQPIPLGFADAATVREDKAGVVWIGTRGQGLIRVDHGRVKRYGVADGLPSGVVQALASDDQRGLWIGTSSGLSLLKDGKLTTYTARDGLAGDSITALLVDRDANLWIGTQGGLNRWRDGRCSRLTQREGLSDDDVRALLEDHEGNVWVAGGGGLTRLSDSVFTTYGVAEGLPSGTVQTITEGKDGGIWIGTLSTGIARLTGRVATRLSVTALDRRSIISIHEGRDGSVWVATDDRRLFRVRGGAVSDLTPLQQTAPAKFPWMFEDERGLVLASSMRGLGRIEAGRFVPLHPRGPTGYYVYAGQRGAGGDLWLATNRGLMRVRQGGYTLFAKADGLAADRVFGLLADADGTLWLATQGGLTCFREGEPPRSLTEREGLPTNHLRVVLRDSRGDLWLSAMGHVFRITRQEVEAWLAGKTGVVTPVRYDTYDGLRTTEVPTGAQSGRGLRSADGRLWFVTAKGLSVVDPARSVVASDAPPSVRIEEVSVNDIPERRAEYPPGAGDLTVRYTALSFRAPVKLTFRYRLEGLSDQWLNAHSERVARFSNLAPGRYTFRVVVESRDRSWPAQEASFSFLLKPHWFQTWWWYGLLVLLAALGAGGLYRWRLRSLRARQEELGRRVEERTARLEEETSEHRLTAERLQREVEERERAQAQLNRLNAELGDRVAERTNELATANEALSGEKERLAVTLRSIGDGVIATDVSGQVVLLNRAAEEISGWSAQDAEGRPLADVLRIVARETRAPLSDPARAVLERGVMVLQPAEALLLARDGREILIADSAAPIRDRDSRIVGVVVVFRDVTERQKMEECLRDAQRLESLSVLAGGIAHDFNNLLSGIFGFIEIAQRSSTPGGKASAALERGLSVLKRARGLTGQLLAFSRAGQPVMAPLALDRLLHDGVPFALSGSNVSADLRIAEDLWLCKADAQQMDQAIDNLLLNARQAMAEGGRVTLSAENVVLPRDCSAPLPDGRYVRLRIRDQGVGIPRELRARIFEPFFTTKPGGTGLGLAITYSIVQKHGGHIEVNSEPGAGTTFTILLPACDEEAAVPKPSALQPVAGKGRVLVLEDEEYLREVVNEALTTLGHEVVAVGHGEQAVALFREARATQRPFDVVILDVNVRGGMGGVATLTQLREIDGGVRAIASSGYSGDIMAHPADYGFRAVLSKPFTAAELGAVLGSVLARP